MNENSLTEKKFIYVRKSEIERERERKKRKKELWKEREFKTTNESHFGPINN